MDKRGELTSHQIVLLVLAIVGFLVVLSIFLVFDFEGKSSDEICKLSVLTRATSHDTFQSSVPLKCTTKKICLTDGKGDCAESFAGEKDVEEIKLPNNELEAVNLIEEISADAMYDCWKMTGEGRYGLFGDFWNSRGLGYNEPGCVVCSRVAIDNGVGDSIVEKVDIREYMANNEVGNTGLTYDEAFAGGKDFAGYTRVNAETFTNKIDNADNSNKLLGKQGTIDYNNKHEIAFVFSQIDSVEPWNAVRELSEDGLIVVGASFITPKFLGGISRALLLNKAGLAVAVGVLASSGINAYYGQTLAAGYCGNVATNYEESKEGCSIVQAVPYTAENVNKICGFIDGSP